MSLKLIASQNPALGHGRGWSQPEDIGGCVVCKRFIVPTQAWGRARLPMLGKAHTWCGGR